MIIEAKPLPEKFIKWAASIVSFILKRRFNKLVISPAHINPNSSYILMCNHFSFWDGFLAAYLTLHAIHKKQPLNGFYIMILKKQLQKNMWLRYFGCFSVAPRSSTVNESLEYAAGILNTPGNVLLLYPQGNLESNHVRHIELKSGVSDILSKVTGNCQLIWSSNLVEYFESLKPSVYFHMLDCGSNADFDFTKMGERINRHHKEAIQKQFRFTEELAN